MSKVDTQFVSGGIVQDHGLRNLGIFLILVFLTISSFYLFHTGNLFFLYLVFLVITSIFGIVALSKAVLYFIYKRKPVNALDYVKKKPEGVYLIGHYARIFELREAGDKQIPKETIQFTKSSPERI
jgi:hypothetical protein